MANGKPQRVRKTGQPPPPPDESLEDLDLFDRPAVRRRAQEIREGRRESESRDLINELRARFEAERAGEFEQARRGFTSGLRQQLGAGVAGAQRQFTQQAGRRGLAFSGVEQAGLQAVTAAGQQQFARSLADFETRLSLARQQEESRFRQAEFEFMARLKELGVKADLEKEILAFQARLASDSAGLDFMKDMVSAGTQIGLSFLFPPAAPAIAAAGVATREATGSGFV